MPSTVELLKSARDLIADPERWCQESYAEDSIGAPCNPEFADAQCFCSLGAIYRVSGGAIDAVSTPNSSPEATKAMHILGEAAFSIVRAHNPDALDFKDSNVVTVNDGEELSIYDSEEARQAAHADVMRMYEMAIAAAEHRSGA